MPPYDSFITPRRHPAHATLPELRRNAPFIPRASAEYKAYPDPPSESPPYDQAVSAASSSKDTRPAPRPRADVPKTDPYLSSADSKLTMKKSLRRGLLKLSALSAFRSKRDHPADNAMSRKSDTTQSRS